MLRQYKICAMAVLIKENGSELSSYTKLFAPGSACLLAYTDELLRREISKENYEGKNSVEKRISRRCTDPDYARERDLVLSLWRRYKNRRIFRTAYNIAVDAMPLEFPPSDGLK